MMLITVTSQLISPDSVSHHFSLHTGYENIGNDHQTWNVLMFNQILWTSSKKIWEDQLREYACWCLQGFWVNRHFDLMLQLCYVAILPWNYLTINVADKLKVIW